MYWNLATDFTTFIMGVATGMLMIFLMVLHIDRTTDREDDE